MPELPEVETVVRALRGALTGRKLLGAECLGRCRRPFDARTVASALGGSPVVGVRRRAKYIVVDFPCGRGLLAHLGMTGYFHLEPVSRERHRHDRLVLQLDGGEELRYADARRFGFVVFTESCGPDGFPAELGHLGLEPLARACTGRALLKLAAGRKTPVKPFIMDQSVVTGVGNIYASEALHGAGIDPDRPAGALEPEEWRLLASEMKTVLRRALRRGGSTIRNYRTVDGTEGSFQRSLKVYGRAGEACPRCGGTIETIRQGGRSTFFCPACQG